MRDETPLQYPLPTRFARVQLTQDWFACDGANFVFLGYSDHSTPLAQQDIGWGFDPMGIIAGMLLAVDDNGAFKLPNGSQLTVWQPPDALDGHWEPLITGQNCGSGSESSGEESSSGGCTPTPGYMQAWPNFEANTMQVLGHDAAHCFGWVDVETCGSGGGGSGSCCNLAQTLAAGHDAGGSNALNFGQLTTINNTLDDGSGNLLLSFSGVGSTLRIGAASPTYSGLAGADPTFEPSNGQMLFVGGILCTDSVANLIGASILLADVAGANINFIWAGGGWTGGAEPYPTGPDMNYVSQSGLHYFGSFGSGNLGEILSATLNLTGLPSGTLISPPAGLAIGDVWQDTTTSAQYPILRIRKT